MNRSKETISSGKGYAIVGLPEQLRQDAPNMHIIRKLVELYIVESKQQRTFYEKCDEVVEAALALGLGLERESGIFHLDKVSSRRGKRLWLDMPHTWLKDDSGIYYELTGEQFNKGLHTKFKRGVTVIYPGTELYERYTPWQKLRQRKRE